MDYIECPICEHQFQEPSSEQVATCPSCQRKFLVSSAGRVSLSVKPSKSAVPRPDIVEQNVEAQKEREKVEASKPLELQPDPNAAEATDDTPQRLREKSAAARAKGKRRRRKRLLATIAASVAFAIVSGVLGGILVMQLSKSNNDKIAAINKGPVEDEMETTAKLQSDNNAAPLADTDTPVRTQVDDKPIKLEDLPKQKSRFHKQSALNECWSIVRPHLVELKVHDIRGTHNAVGTIVDSRGWIVTSYQAIKGATKIEVIASAKSIDDIGEDRLTDEVRGIVSSASNPNLDLAVLAINRRFVESFADIKLASFVRVVSGSYLAQCAPPNKENPYARTEASVKSRGDGDSIPAFKKVESEVPGSTEITWLTAESETKPLPGTPLTTITGELTAINSYSNGETGYYILLEKLADMIQSSDGTVEPLSSLGGLSTEGGTVEINQFHPLLADVQILNQLGDGCNKFDWIATEQEQYSQLQQFGAQIAIIKNYVSENPDEDQESLQPIEEQLNRWQNTLIQKFSNSDQASREKIKEMNLLAEQQLRTGEQCVPLVAASHTPDFGQNRLVFQMEGMDSGVSIPFDPDADPKRPGINFLLFVMTPAQSKTVVYALPSGPLSAHNVELVFDAGPL